MKWIMAKSLVTKEKTAIVENAKRRGAHTPKVTDKSN